MKLPTKSMPKWLLLPPAVALLLVLGPLSMQGNAADRSQPQEPAPAAAPATPPATAGRTVRQSPQPPRSPDLLQVGATLVGVLLLGAGAVLLLRRLRGGVAPTKGSPLAILRQTLRLSAKQAVHAIEFDDRILLVGEHDRGLVLLDSGKIPERAADEAEVTGRRVPDAHPEHATAAHADDEGATPRNLLIPRPPQPAARRLPTPPMDTAAAAAAGERRASPGLNDFRTLLQKAGRA